MVVSNRAKSVVGVVIVLGSVLAAPLLGPLLWRRQNPGSAPGQGIGYVILVCLIAGNIVIGTRSRGWRRYASYLAAVACSLPVLVDAIARLAGDA